MDLFVTCECSRRTNVTPAKCGKHVNCLCGKSVLVTPLSILRTQCQNFYAELGEPAQPSRPVESKVARPVRPIPLGFAFLLVLYGSIQSLRLPMSYKIGPQAFGFTLGIAAIAFVGSLLLYRASTKAD